MNNIAQNLTLRQRVSTIEFLPNSIVVIKIDDNVELTLEDFLAHYKALRGRYDGSTKYRLMVEPGLFSSITNEARSFSANTGNNKITMATAVIIKSLAQRLVINFMINSIQKHSMKIQMFDSKEKAIEWLLEIKN